MSPPPFKPGDDVWVDFDGGRFPGEVLDVAPSSGYIMCVIQTDPAWDHGRSSAWVMPHQTVAARSKNVHPRNDEEHAGD